MKVVQIHTFGGPEVLKTETIEEPTPNENEVKIKLFATGLNPSETYTISGNYGYLVPDLPYVPGFDGSGVIEEVGPNVEGFQKGDRVFLSAFAAKRNTGTYAEKVVVDADVVYHLPDNISFKEGAALGIPVFTAYRALILKARIRAGETVLIHGASGAVGSMAVQIAKGVGAVVIGTSSTEEGRQQVLDIGADYALNHISDDNMEELMELTNQKGPNVIIEMLANANLETDTEMIADDGRIVIVGSRGSIEITPRNLMTSEATVTGMTFTYPTKEDMDEMIHGVTALLEMGAIQPIVGDQFTLDEAGKAHTALMETSGNGRTIFVIAEE